MEPTRLKPDQEGSYLSLAFGIVCAAIGVAMVANGSGAGVVVLVLGAVGLYAGVAGFVPGLGLRLDQQGFYLKSLGKSWGASWVETDGFTPTRVRVGRRADVDVVEIRYQPGIGDRREPRHLLGRFLGIDERYLIAGYGGLSNAQLAELLEKYRAASV
jgi:hypothetical protein